MVAQTPKRLIQGPSSIIELAFDFPETQRWLGIALVAHPHPLFGGNMTNKVAQTLARTFAQLGYACVRLNFRGVGESTGIHDNGIGEQDDILAILAWMRQANNWADLTPAPSSIQLNSCPLVLGGFSFGSYVLSHVAARLAHMQQPAQRLVFIGTPTSKWHIASVPADTIVIHGEQDDTIPLTSVFDWAREQQNLPVTVIPGADHFFHGKLAVIKQCITGAWHTPIID
ncbi:MAG: alpha/beta hydrolase [Ottowia sp.]|nr:alpha/beta hydrolase [Ottowia sp.]